MDTEMDFDTLLMTTLMDCKINSKDGSFSGYVDTEDTFKDLMTNMQACGYCYSVRGSHVYATSQQTQAHTPARSGDETSFYANSPDSSDGKSLFDISFKDKEKTSIHFKSQQGSVPIPYFGLGFTIERNTYFECTQGPRYYKKKVPKENIILTDTGIQRIIKRRNASSKKRNCPAVILLKCIRIYPEFVEAGAKEPHWKIKREVADQIRKALKSSPGPMSFLRYYIKASPQSCHSHETEAEKEMRLFARYELKKERSRNYKKARLLRKRQHQEITDIDLDETLTLQKKYDNPATMIENDFNMEECFKARCARDGIDLAIEEDQLDIGDHMVMVDGQLLEINALGDQLQMGHEQLEMVDEELEMVDEQLEMGDEQLEMVDEQLEMVDVQLEEEPFEIEEEQIFDTEEEDINTLLLNLRKEAQKIVTLSSDCKNVHVINQTISLLKEASTLLEEPPPLVTTTSVMKKVTIPINEVFTSHSDNFFTFTLNEACSKPTCVVFVQ